MRNDRIILIGREADSGVWQGRVHSRFARAVNVTARGALYTLLAEPAWISENNIVVPPAVLSLPRPGAAVSFDGRALRCSGVLLARKEGTKVWAMPEVRGADAPDFSLLAPRLEARPADGLAGAVRRRFLDAAGCFVRGEGGDFRRVIGAGPGLTPSGDDMLTGLALAALHSAPGTLPDLAGLCAPWLDTTTDLSRHMLRDALRGKFAAPLVEVLLALRAGREATVRAADAAGEIGASSGEDGMFGLYHGLRLFHGRIPARAGSTGQGELGADAGSEREIPSGLRTSGAGERF